MANSVKTSSITLRQLIFWAAVFALTASFALFIFEKSRVTNIYTKPASTATIEAPTRPVNSVDYSPATSTEKPDSSAKKQDTPTATNSSTSGKINIVLSAAGQDIKGGPVVIRTILDGATGGTCTATLINGSTLKTYNSDVILQGTYYSCKGFDVPYADLFAGNWQLKVTATQDNKTGETSKTITIEGS